MYWDVVEVKPEPHYCLLVRFKDGATGRVQLRPEELTGVLEPLRDEHFFELQQTRPAKKLPLTASRLVVTD